MKYEIHRRDDFIEIVTHGDGDAAVFQAILTEVLTHQDWKSGTPILVNHSDLNAGPLTVREMSTLADMMAAARVELGTSRMAILAPNDLEFGLGRMWQVFADKKWDGTSKIFRGRENAVSWLTQA